jgi:hypothetical protein
MFDYATAGRRSSAAAPKRRLSDKADVDGRVKPGHGA